MYTALVDAFEAALPTMAGIRELLKSSGFGEILQSGAYRGRTGNLCLAKPCPKGHKRDFEPTNAVLKMASVANVVAVLTPLRAIARCTPRYTTYKSLLNAALLDSLTEPKLDEVTESAQTFSVVE